MCSQILKPGKKRGGFEELQRDVITKKLCTGCGACYITCPFKGVLEYADGPLLGGECSHCGICLRVCPRYNVDVKSLEIMVFGRERKPGELFGIYKAVYIARSTDDKVLAKCQDGGVSTTILLSALASGTIDGAAISGVDSLNPWLPTPILAIKADDIIENAGTRYSYSPSLIAYYKGLSNGVEKMALVGTPCQVLAMRRIQEASLRRYSKALAFTIGLFCFECFSYAGLMVEKIREGLGIDLRKIEKMNIKGELILQMRRGERVKIPLKETRGYVEAYCHHCNDFTAELSDISVGGIGLDGWTFTIVRTDRGSRVFDHALNKDLLIAKPVEEFRSSYNLMKKLSKIKRARKGKG